MSKGTCIESENPSFRGQVSVFGQFRVCFRVQSLGFRVQVSGLRV